MKRFLLIPLVIVLVSGLIFGGCAAPAPAPAKPGVIKLTYASHNTLGSWEQEHAASPWLKSMEEATGGRVKFEPYWADTLCKAPDAWEAVKTGVADTAWNFFGYWPGMTPLADVVSLPFMPWESAAQTGGALWKLYEKYPTVANLFKDNKILLFWASTPYFIITTEKQVKTMEDLAGLKLRITGGPPTEASKALGIVPMLHPMSETYINLQKGVTDGMAIPWEAIVSWRQYELVKYYTYVPLWNVYFCQTMNMDKWNSLPPDIQKAIMSVGGLEGSALYSKNMFDSIALEGREQLLGSGYEMIEYTLPQEELERWVEVAGQPVWENWVKEMEAKGYPEAQEILDTTLELLKTYHP